MTDEQLLTLYHRRETASADIARSGQMLKNMLPKQRQACDAASARLHNVERDIVRELKARGAPAHLPGVTLWMTVDELNFVACRPRSQIPLAYVSPTSTPQQTTSGVLKRYPSEQFVTRPVRGGGARNRSAQT